MDQLRILRRKLRTDIKLVEAQFDNHLSGGSADSSCSVCASYQNRIFALKHAIIHAGGNEEVHDVIDSKTV